MKKEETRGMNYRVLMIYVALVVTVFWLNSLLISTEGMEGSTAFGYVKHYFKELTGSVPLLLSQLVVGIGYVYWVTKRRGRMARAQKQLVEEDSGIAPVGDILRRITLKTVKPEFVKHPGLKYIINVYVRDIHIAQSIGWDERWGELREQYPEEIGEMVKEVEKIKSYQTYYYDMAELNRRYDTKDVRAEKLIGDEMRLLPTEKELTLHEKLMYGVMPGIIETVDNKLNDEDYQDIFTMYVDLLQGLEETLDESMRLVNGVPKDIEDNATQMLLLFVGDMIERKDYLADAKKKEIAAKMSILSGNLKADMDGAQDRRKYLKKLPGEDVPYNLDDDIDNFIKGLTNSGK